MTGIEVTLAEARARRGDGILLVDGVDAEAAGAFKVRVEVMLPEDLPPGRYVIRMGNDRTGLYPSKVIRVGA